MLNILITGVNGQLGSTIKLISVNYVEYNFFFTDSNNLNITNHLAVLEYVEKNNINIIINCAAYTSVDNAEIELQLASDVNHLAVQNLAYISKSLNIKLVHISTDYVFDGLKNQPYSETDVADPLTNYGKTKLNGEIAIKNINPSNSIIIRTSWLYSTIGNNFVKKILLMAKENNQLNIVSDQIGCPTNAFDLANTIFEILPLVKNKSVEIFHYSNEGKCSWYDFAIAILEFKKISIKIHPILSSNYKTNARRPKYSVLDKTKIKKNYNIDIPFWKDSLYLALQSY